MKTLIVMMVCASALGCGGKGDGAPPAAPVDAAERARPPLVDGYEALRDTLAQDDLAGAKSAASALVPLADGALKAPALALSQAADIEVARRLFGDLSKAYLELLQRSPDMAEGLFAFRCPMAEGYQKWVQVDEPMKNPYMGKRMLECGSKVELAP